jgi:hypothetical protein
VAAPLRVIDVPGGTARPLGRYGHRQQGRGVWGQVITSQAWAPDDRRLVLMTDDGELRIVDTVTQTSTSLGPGSDATWSPDGTLIGARVPHSAENPEDADYVVTAPPVLVRGRS